MIDVNLLIAVLVGIGVLGFIVGAVAPIGKENKRHKSEEVVVHTISRPTYSPPPPPTLPPSSSYPPLNPYRADLGNLTYNPDPELAAKYGGFSGRQRFVRDDAERSTNIR